MRTLGARTERGIGSSMVTQSTQTRTAMIDGKEVEADKAAEIHEVREIFSKLKKALKTIALYRHNTERYSEYLEPVHTAMADFLARKGTLQLRVEAMAYKYKGSVVFEDDSRENNLIYPYYLSGIRLFIFKAGLSPDELLAFLMLAFDGDSSGRGEPILTSLWKQEFESIEYIVVEGFKVADDDDAEDVEVEIEKVVAYLYKQLQSNAEDHMRFARVSAADLDLELDGVDSIRGAVIQGRTATAADMARVQTSLEAEETQVLPKLVTVFFQLLELDTTEENFEDVADAFVQLLDALLLQENFTAVAQIRERFATSSQKPNLSPVAKEMIERCGERFNAKMAEGQRIQTIGQILNGGLAKDADGVRGYLYSLGPDAVLPLVDMLESIELLPNRRLIADVLADIGRDQVGVFTSRLTHPSSNLVKDMLYIIDKINPPEKFAIFAHVLGHPNAILRLETLALIGKNPSEECFSQIKRVAVEHEDAQMRAAAIRSLPNFEPSWAVPVVLQIVQSEDFQKMGDPEKRALFTALGQLHTAETQGYLVSLFEQKSSLLAKRKVDEMKMWGIFALEAAPSMASLQLLAAVAKDTKRHSKEVAEAARAAVVQMKARIMGAGA